MNSELLTASEREIAARLEMRENDIQSTVNESQGAFTPSAEDIGVLGDIRTLLQALSSEREHSNALREDARAELAAERERLLFHGPEEKPEQERHALIIWANKELNGHAEKPEGKATPFLKWVGGKRSIISELTARVPENLGHYYEPFVGGGALFFELRERIAEATLADQNVDLILTYKIIRDEVEKLIARLRQHAAKHSKEHYYNVRSWHELRDPIEVAARLIYLNKTCYNGLYRVNSSGEFNVPMGNYTNPGIVQEENLRACNEALRGVEVRIGDFTQIKPNAGDFVYFDPPYHPVSDTANFTSYGHNGFDESDQKRLHDFIVTLHEQGVRVMLSNSNTPFIQSLYTDNFFRQSIVNAPRLVNCKPNKRNSVEEVLITNYAITEVRTN